MNSFSNTSRINLVWQLLALCLLFAQSADAQPGLPDQNIVVISELKPVLADAVKVVFNPELPPVESKKPNVNYQVPVTTIEVPYHAPDVKPLAMKAEMKDPLKNVFAKIGYGNLNTPFADVYISTGRGKKYSNRSNNLNAGIHTSYIGSKSKMENQQYSDLDTRLFGTYYADMVAVSGEFNFNKDVVHFYGYNHEDTSFTPASVKQHFNFFNGSFRINNAKNTSNDINYDGKIEVNYIADKFKHSEVNPVFHLAIDKKFRNDNKLIGKLLINHNTYQFDTTKTNRTIVSFNPTYKLIKEDWLATLGIDVGTDDEGFYIYPDITFERELVGKSLVFEAGLGGSISANNYASLSRTNPFINDRADIHHSRDLFVKAGFKGAPFDNFSYGLRANYHNIKYLPLFLNDTADFKRFTILYDTNATVFNFHAEFAYSLGEKIRFLLSGDLFSYSMSKNDNPWHLPGLKVELDASFMASEKLKIGGAVYYIGGTTAVNETGLVENLNGVVDINLNASYLISDSFHIFANINNIAAAKHQRWYRYHGYGLNAIGGIILIF